MKYISKLLYILFNQSSSFPILIFRMYDNKCGTQQIPPKKHTHMVQILSNIFGTVDSHIYETSFPEMLQGIFLISFRHPVVSKYKNGFGAWWRVQKVQKSWSLEFWAFKIMKSEFYCANLKQIDSRKLLKIRFKHISPLTAQTWP